MAVEGREEEDAMYGEREGEWQCAGESRMYMQTGHTKVHWASLHSLTVTDYSAAVLVASFVFLYLYRK